jgi:hypothetical protein
MICLQQLLEDQIAEVNRKFTGLHLQGNQKEHYTVAGILEFHVAYEDKRVEDAYNVEIQIADDYPCTVPRTSSADGKVPKEFHTYPENMTFCTAAPLIEKLKFFEHPTLKNYIEKLLIPYLFSYSCLQKYGELPYGDLGHGAPGILNSYKELFCVYDDFVVLGILKFLAYGKYKGHYPCPCGSKRKLRECHSSLIHKVIKYHSKKEFESEYRIVFMHLMEIYKEISGFAQYIPSKLKRVLRRQNVKKSIGR